MGTSESHDDPEDHDVEETGAMSRARGEKIRMSNAKIENLNQEIAFIGRQIEAKTERVRLLVGQGKQRDALAEANQIKMLNKQAQSKRDTLKLLQDSLCGFSAVADFADAQHLVTQLTDEKKRIANELNIDVVRDTNMDSRVVDRDLEKILASVGISEEDRAQDEQADLAFMQSLLLVDTTTGPANTVTAPVVTTTTTSATTTTRNRSPLDSLLNF